MKALAARSLLGIAGLCLTGVLLAVSLYGQEASKTGIVEPTTPDQLEAQNIGVTAIDRLAASLANEVKSALAGSAPEDALDFCHLKGLPTTPGEILRGMPRIAAVKFASLKFCASDNESDLEDKAVLDAIDVAIRSGKAAPSVVLQRVENPGSTAEWRVYKPIATATSCLACHGNPADQSPNLRAKLKDFYPEEQTAGDKWKDWHGVIRVTVSDTPAN